MELFEDRMRAATPATCGVAIDVPDLVVRLESLETPADTIEDPGAKMSRHVPWLEKLERASWLVVEPTV